MRLVTAKIPNEPGALARIADNLAEAEVNISGFVADVDHIHILTDAGPAVLQALEEHGIEASEDHVFKVQVDDRPGQLAELSGRLAKAGINIEVAFGMGYGQRGHVYLGVSDSRKADAIIRAMYPSTPPQAPDLGRI